MPVIIALGRQRQRKCMLQANLGSREKICNKENKRKKKKIKMEKKTPFKPAKH